MTTETLAAADITLSQLGGSHRLKSMINAREFYSENEGRTLRFKFSMCSEASVIRITLNSLDLYDVEFIKPGRLNRKTWEMSAHKIAGSFTSVYADDLRQIIEDFTGLRLGL